MRDADRERMVQQERLLTATPGAGASIAQEYPRSQKRRTASNRSGPKKRRKGRSDERPDKRKMPPRKGFRTTERIPPATGQDYLKNDLPEKFGSRLTTKDGVGTQNLTRGSEKNRKHLSQRAQLRFREKMLNQTASIRKN